jgi:nucleoside-diphosphate-sugar epimerase
MIVALTGASGYLGSHLVQQLHALGHRVRGLARPTSDVSLLQASGADIVIGDMTDYGSLRRLVDGADAVIHNAWNWQANRQGPIANWQVNVTPSFGLLELARQTGIGQFLFVSSCAVYGHILPDRPLDETHPAWPDSLYGAGKAAIEDMAMAYSHQYGLNTSSWRPAVVYGIHPRRPERATWRELIRDVATGKPFDSDAGISVNSVEDTAHAIALAVGRREVAGQLYNLVDCYVYLQQIAQLAKELSGSNARIVDRIGPAKPRYVIVSDHARRLGARLNRGLDGIRAHVARVLEATP